MSPWLIEIAELVHAGRRDEAIAVSRQRAAEGNLAATVRLAKFGEEAGISREDADQIVDRASETASAEDADVHQCLSGAYAMGLGRCDYEEKARRSFLHEVRYAELTSNAATAYAIAIKYLNGQVGLQPDAALAIRWLRRAADLGHATAADDLKRTVA